jgi:hypothetical protein
MNSLVQIRITKCHTYVGKRKEHNWTAEFRIRIFSDKYQVQYGAYSFPRNPLYWARMFRTTGRQSYRKINGNGLSLDKHTLQLFVCTGNSEVSTYTSISYFVFDKNCTNDPILNCVQQRHKHLENNCDLRRYNETGRSGFDSRQVQEIILLDSFHTGSGAYPVSYTMVIDGPISGGKASGAWNWPLTSI